MAKRFETEEFEAIFHCYKDMVFKTAYLILGDAEKADDVLQEVFIKVHKSLGAFDPQKGKFKTWLHRITVNQSISERRHKRMPSLSLERLEEQGVGLPGVSSQLPEELLMKKEESKTIQRAMQSLDTKHRAVLVLRYFDDLSYDEIAQALEIPLGTAKSRLNTATKVLRQKLVEGGFIP